MAPKVTVPTPKGVPDVKVNLGSTIPLSMVVAGGAALIGQTVESKISVAGGVKIIVGAFVAGIGLSLLANLNAELAGALAIVAAIGSVLINGGPLFTGVNNLLNPPIPPSQGTKTGP